MTDAPITLRVFYVYALFRGDWSTPFYVGMGISDRWLQHEQRFEPGNPHKNNIIRKMIRDGWPEIPKAKLATDLTRAEAAQIERDMIRLIGRRPNGPLANKTDGGEGLWNPDEETRAKMRAARALRVITEKTREKLSAAGKGRKYPPRSPEWRASLSAANKGRHHTAETKAKMSANRKGRLVYPHQIEVLKAARAIHGEKMNRNLDQTGKRHSQEAIERIGKASRDRAERMRELGKKRWEDPDFRARMMATWTPERRAETGRQSRERAQKKRD